MVGLSYSCGVVQADETLQAGVLKQPISDIYITSGERGFKKNSNNN